MALPGQHGGNDGHLIGIGDWGKIEFVGKERVTDQEDLVADVTAYGNYAYLANWGEAHCSGPEKGGVNAPMSARGSSTSPIPPTRRRSTSSRYLRTPVPARE